MNIGKTLISAVFRLCERSEAIQHRCHSRTAGLPGPATLRSQLRHARRNNAINRSLPIFSLVALLPVLALSMGIAATAFGAAEEQGSHQVQLPKGVIVMWSGNMEEIPKGWSLCDGTKGTPDLRDRFVVGAGSSAHVGVKGGSYSHAHKQDTHSHRVTMPRSRVNTLRIPYGSRGNYGSLSYKIQQQRHYADSRVANSSKLAPVIQTAQNLPPYLKLVFIMKN